jgi:homogentisate 1,2-dioxygenase
MSHYYCLGEIPRKRHTQFRKADGSLYSEELVSSGGFSDVFSLVYHSHPPTMVRAIDSPYLVEPIVIVDKNMQHRSFRGFNVASERDYLVSRKPLLVNDDLQITLAAPSGSMDSYYYKNADADELIFFHEGQGKLQTMYGNLAVGPGDHVLIPRGTIYRITFDTASNRLFIIESYSAFRFPKKYVNEAGQLLEHSPYSQRDIRVPSELETHTESGDFLILIKKHGLVFPYHYANHPFDVIGWDGYLYPYALSINDFEPITGRVHQPPPVHQTFEAENFVVCAFVPRLFDYHPLSIPVPYNHTNIGCDEILYYLEGEFMSRKHVERGQITLHPIGIPHGPHPGTVEKSLGHKETKEMALMLDTFRPLKLTNYAMELEDKDYYKSWLE